MYVNHLSYLLLVTSYCNDLGLYNFSVEIKTVGESLAQDPRIIDFSFPEIQYRALRYIELSKCNSNCHYFLSNNTVDFKTRRYKLVFKITSVVHFLKSTLKLALNN